MLVAGAFAAAAFLAGDDRPPSAAAAREHTGAAASASVHHVEPRPVYRYSVVSGGVYSGRELSEAAAADPVVAAHYAHVSMRDVRVHRVAAERRVYMSYRQGDRIYWTKQPVRLPAGETVLTDGAASIRARCGNAISETPMEPTASAEPSREEFDATDPPPLLPVDPGARALAPPALLTAAAPFPLRPVDSVGVPTVHGPPNRPAAVMPLPTAAIPGAGVVPGDPVQRIAVPRVPVPPRTAVSAPPGYPAGLPIPPFTPQPPRPVPEPATLFLLGSGLGAYGVTRLRRRR